MKPEQLKKYLINSIMNMLSENYKRSKESKKQLDKLIKMEKDFLKNLSEKKKEEYNKLSFQETMYSGSEACDEIKFAINFVVDLFLSMK